MATEFLQRPSGVQCTAGAIPVKNEKGQTYMQKVKVQRYVTGKRPGFAAESDSEEEFDQTENQDLGQQQQQKREGRGAGADANLAAVEPTEEELNDPRFRRIMQAKKSLVPEGESDNEEEEEDRLMRHKRYRYVTEGHMSDGRSSEEENEQDADEEELAGRRELIRQRALQARRRKEEEELAAAFQMGGGAGDQDADEEEDEDEEDEEEEYSSSGDEMAPKLKPVFVRKQDRITLRDKQRADMLAKEAAEETERLANERRRDTLKILEAEIRREAEEARVLEDELDAIDSDDGRGDPSKEQEEYELWKVRELKRIRREREAKEAIEQEKEEIERIRRMTDAQRREEFRKNPKKITNKAPKGKYKFLQKYFHRGAFFVSTEEEKLFQRDFAAPTLEDHFDKTKLRAVMQVKNFGRAGRTKYTHLVDQDTTDHDKELKFNSAMADNFQKTHGGGFKQIFEKPTAKRKR
uniref:Microfibrillar-associated protein 1 n=1 Tax=Schistocephalus solidus TaxID=70667 RepID=A0A0V0J6H8_SCHSO